MSHEISTNTEAYFARVDAAKIVAREMIPNLQAQDLLPVSFYLESFYQEMSLLLADKIAFEEKFHHLVLPYLSQDLITLLSRTGGDDQPKVLSAASRTLRRELAVEADGSSHTQPPDRMARLARMLYYTDNLRERFGIDVEKPIERTPEQEAQLLLGMDQIVRMIKENQ